MEQIIIALITAGLSLVGVMITNYFNNKSLSDKVTHQLDTRGADAQQLCAAHTGDGRKNCCREPSH